MWKFSRTVPVVPLPPVDELELELLLDELEEELELDVVEELELELELVELDELVPEPVEEALEDAVVVPDEELELESSRRV